MGRPCRYQVGNTGRKLKDRQAELPVEGDQGRQGKCALPRPHKHGGSGHELGRVRRGLIQVSGKLKEFPVLIWHRVGDYGEDRKLCS